MLWLSPFSWPRAPLSGIITTAWLCATIDIYIIKSEILTASISTKNVIVSRSRDHPTCDIGESDMGCKDPIWCYARRSTVKIVLPDIYTESFDIWNLNIGESYVYDAPCSIVIGLDAQSVGGVCDDRVRESVNIRLRNSLQGPKTWINLQDIRNIVARSRPTTSYRQPVTSRTEHITDGNITGIWHNYVVILIPDFAVVQ